MSLFEPLSLRELNLRNRVGVSPMCQYSAVDGLPQAWHITHLVSRAVGGAGLVIAEATGVLPEGRITPGCTGLWSDAHAQAWAPIVAEVKAHGAVAGIQIGHAGRKGSADLPWKGGAHLSKDAGGWDTVAPSALAFGGALDKVPVELDEAGIARIKQAFVDAAKRALAAGFEFLELHGAHGYLMHQFLSPITNKRTDGWGGDFDGRTRLLRETAEAVRQVWPQRLPLAVRLSATDWMPDTESWDLAQTVELAKRLKALGVDLIDCSSGGLVPDAKIPAGPGFQVPFAEAVKKQAGIATAAVGWISEPDQAEAVVAEGKADLVLLARAFLRDPYWAHHAAQKLGLPELCKLPVQYARA